MLKKLHQKGCTIKEMQQVFPDRSFDSIRHRLSRFELKPNHSPEKINYDIYKELMSVEEV
jgi:hypothetical protein